jgi:hypothetical protein
MSTFAFAGGVTQTSGWGDKWVLMFGGSWNFNDTWELQGSGNGPFTVGAGNVNGVTGAALAFPFTYRNRVYITLGNQFNFSDNADPTQWEQQGPGAGFVKYLSYLGAQDVVNAFGQLQGRLAVFARRTIQLWNVDADPANFSLVQQLDNIGTAYPLSVQELGDFDALFLDDTGYRSLRSREVTLNAYVDDIGSAVDELAQADLLANNTPVCGIVDPSTKNYWCVLNGKVYVLSRHPAGKVTAWSQYSPTYESVAQPQNPNFDNTGHNQFVGLANGGLYYLDIKNGETITQGPTVYTTSQFLVMSSTQLSIFSLPPGFNGPVHSVVTRIDTPFTAQKFVVLAGSVYCRGVGGELLQYGGSSGAVYDRCQVTLMSPYLDDKRSDTNKISQGIGFVIEGRWQIFCSMNPADGTPATQVAFQGSATLPDDNKDSSYDQGWVKYDAQGTHFSFKAVSWNQSTSIPATFSSLVFKYNEGQK